MDDSLVILFLDVPDFPGYRVGSDGHVYSYKIRKKIDFTVKPKKLKAHPYSTGKYLHVGLRRDGKTFTKSIHRLVCSAFNGPAPVGSDCSHINGDDKDNRPSNLIWESRKKNCLRKISHGTDDCGSRNKRAMFTKEDILQIRKLLKDGTTHKDISRKFDCDERDIGKIKRGERYARD